MFANRVKETTTTTGTGNLTLAGAATNFETFNSAFGLNRRFGYFIVDATNNVWEAGIGYLSAATTLVRETVLDNSSNTTTALTLAAGTKDVICSPSENLLIPGLPTIRNPNSLGKVMLPFNLEAAQGNAVTVTADRLYLVPVLYLQAGLVSAMKVYVSTAVASSKARMGLYEMASDGAPGRLILESGDITTTTTGMLSAAALANARVRPGWYYLALIASGAVAFNKFNDGSGWKCGTNPCGTTATGNAIFSLYDTIAAGWTALPDPPTIDGTDVVACPAILLEYT